VNIDDMPDRALRPDDKLTVKWTEVAVDKFEVSATAQELADLMGIEVDEVEQALANYDHDLSNDLGEWNGGGSILADFQREDIAIKFSAFNEEAK
jgi:hypothetical protein